MMYAHTNDEIYFSFYAGSRVTIPLKDGKVKIIQKTGYPFDEDIIIEIDSIATNQKFTLRMRIPTWAGSQFVPGNLYRYVDDTRNDWKISVNGKILQPKVNDGFISIRRKWKAGDIVALHLPIPLRYTQANVKVEANLNRVCLTRGPLVYCAEDEDNKFSVLQAYIETLTNTYTVKTPQEGVMKGIDFVTIPAKTVKDGGVLEVVEMTLLPYYAWNNRSENAMIVWIPRKQ